MTDSPARRSFSDLKPHIVVATPCYGGMVTQRYMQSTFAFLQFGTQAGWPVSIELLGNDSLITRSRNALVTRFLDIEDATHLMFIDADIGFEVEQIARMVMFDEDVVAGLYPLKLIDWQTGGFARVCAGESMDTAPLRYVGTPCEGEARRTREGFVTGVYAGTGFLLIKRGVIERMNRAYPQLRFRGTHTTAAPRTDRDEFALFDCMIDPDSQVYLSEDYAFCRRWRDLGGEIWLDTQGRLTHVGGHDFHGEPALRFPAPGLTDAPGAVAAE